MDLSLPLRSLTPSLDADVLAVLAGTESSLGVSQVARLAARGSRPGVAKVLNRLVEHGLVLAHPTNLGHVYQLNRHHLLTPVLLAALAVRGQVRTLLTQQVTTLDPAPMHASVFGSLARGAGGPGSDIDVLLVVPDGLDVHDEQWVAQLRGIQEQVLAATGNRLEPLVITLSGLQDAADTGEALVGSLTDEADTLHGVQFADLLARKVTR